ncbi:hypothetical protein HMPREF0973_01248 [Prevotella veroralis F0319]|uniref:Uncharacterized protein n=1 Tax=Prevotella veroralis F0319 TaxID=649761 RepID=C9MNR0_9BACT|nr:hypothetical protein HMPREF0973_01248 [Prevotella veroralis F0319]
MAEHQRLTCLRIVSHLFQHSFSPVPAFLLTRSAFPSHVLRISFSRVAHHLHTHIKLVSS